MYRKLFIGLNTALFVGFVIAFIIDNNAEWKDYQKSYYAMAAKAAKDPAEAKAWKRRPVEIKQIIAKELGNVDRCVTCHVGMDEYTNPTLANDFTENPYKAHPNVDKITKGHPFQKFGCTSCHAGQGLATTVEDAHGFTHNWTEPLLKGNLIQASCVKCHGNYQSLKGAEVSAKGRALMEKHGCFGCHSIRGEGGIVSVDLGDIADKPMERINPHHFHIMKKKGQPLPHDEWNIQEWIRGHLTNDPMVIVHNDPHGEFNAEPIAPSGMPNFTEELSYEDAEAITAYLMSMTAEQVPNRYYVYAAPKPEPKFAGAADHGKYVFQKYGCQGCHGLGGAKGRRNYNAMGPGQEDKHNDMDKGVEPTLTDVVGTFTRDELRVKIQNGVSAHAISKFNPEGPTPPLYMPAWKDKIKGTELEDLISYLLSIATKKEEAF